jgi:hypothetical protein
MPAEAADQQDRPPRPLPEMGAYELREYCKQLEVTRRDDATGQVPMAGPGTGHDAVLVEEEDRRRPANAR